MCWFPSEEGGASCRVCISHGCRSSIVWSITQSETSCSISNSCHKAAYEEFKILCMALRGTNPGRLEPSLMEEQQNTEPTSAEYLTQRSVHYLDNQDYKVAENAPAHWLSKSSSSNGVRCGKCNDRTTHRYGQGTISCLKRFHNKGRHFLLWITVLRSSVKLSWMHVLMWMRIGSIFIAYRYTGAGIMDQV